MKLQELDNNSKVKQITKIMESYFGNSFSFSRLTPVQANSMLRRVKSMINEQRRGSSIHSSEQNPAYLKLIMMEQALQARLKEGQPYVAGSQEEEGPASTIIRGGPKKLVAAMRAAEQGQSGTTTSPVGAASRPIIRGGGTDVAEGSSKKKVPENAKARQLKEASELQQAQVVLASQDMVDQMQDMIEDVSELQFKDLPALVDQAKSEVGPANANQFQQAATQSLTALLQALQQAKASMEGAQAALTGAAPAPIAGAEGAMPPVPGAEAGAMTPGGEISPPAEPAPAEEPEPVPGGASLGRGRR